MSRRWFARATAVLCCVAASGHVVCSTGQDLFEGRHPALRDTTLYSDGRTPVPPEQAACVNCHRPSGLGSFEGGVVVPPIASGLLAAPYDPATTRRYSDSKQLRIRPAYDAAALHRLLTQGHTPDGQYLSGLMPRYRLTVEEAASLLDHLNRLGVDPTPGVEEAVVHFATITAGDVPAAREKELLTLMDAFFKQKNAGTRQELQRRSSALRNQHVMYSRHRQWVLHHWRLTGPAASWPAQLDEHYRRRPVFAVLSGTGQGDWAPVQDFCERERVPCLMPVTAYPGGAGGFYTAYFSGGAPAQARWLGQTVAQEAPELVRAPWLVLVDEAADAAALGERIAHELRASGLDARTGSSWSGEPVIVSALSPQAVAARLPEADRTSPRQLYLLAGALTPVPVKDVRGLRRDGMEVAWVTQQATAAPALARARAWWRGRDFRPTDESFAAQVLFALSTAVESLVHVDERFSREYCLEKLEHNLENMPPMTSYPRLSLGPGQRMAARSVWLVHER